MNESKMNTMSGEIVEMMEKLAKKHNLQFKRGNILWSEDGFSFKNMQFNEISEDGLDPRAVKEFNAYAPLRHGILESALNVFFTAKNGEKLKIVGYKNRNRKDKFLLENNKGAKFKAPANYILNNVPSTFLA